MRWFESPHYSFTKLRHVAYCISGLLIVISIISIFVRGLEYGIDFTGGKQFVIQFQNPPNLNDLKANLAKALEDAPEVKTFGSKKEVLILTDSDKEISHVQEIIVQNLNSLYPEEDIQILKTAVVGASFADDLRSGAIKAIVISIAVVSVYIFIRFKDWTFSVGAMLALVHDVLITLGLITFLRGYVPFSLEINQTIIAAFLTIVGYSLNDTVVVFDRIRENLRSFKTFELDELINDSINQTLSRTTITSLTTLFAVIVLFIFGGESLKGFTFSLLIGLTVGTYSSISIASNIVLELHKRFDVKMPAS